MRKCTSAGRRRGWRTSCVDPKEHPDAILPDLSKPDPLVKFGKEDIAFVYGSKWKQRYFKKIGDDYFVLPAQWDITHQIWRPYFVRNGTDWWAALYPGGQYEAANGASLRRMPFGQLRHSEKDSHGMECRLREMPRTGRRSREPSFAAPT